MSIYHIDFESYSAADLSKYGAFRYAEDPTTEILICAIAKDDGEVFAWSPHVNENEQEEFQAFELLQEASTDPEAVLYAHNSQFETAMARYLWTETFRLPCPPLERWRCTAAMARRAAIPSNLKDCGAFLGLGQQKDDEGKRLINKFSMPQTKGKLKGERILPEDDPEDFAKFIDYCKQDVRTEREVHKKLHKFELKGEVLESFIFDAQMNHRGVPVNVDALTATDKLVEELTGDVAKEFMEITGYKHTQNIRVKEWMQERGYPCKNMQAQNVEEVLDQDPRALGMDPEAHRALKLYSLVGFAALKKIPTMLAAANTDGRVRGALKWSGAERTHRWAGQIIQPQNFKRPEIKDTDGLYAFLKSRAADKWSMKAIFPNPLLAIASCIRHFIEPKEGKFLDADYAAIEARIVCWLCGQEDSLELFRQGKDVYVVMAAKIFGIDPDDVVKDQRFVGKQTVLGCGYNMGVEKFIGTCASYGQEIDHDTAALAVKTFRSVNDKISGAWRTIDVAAKNAIKNPGKKFNGTDKLTFCYTKAPGFPALLLQLPSGHCLVYPRPKLVPCFSVFISGKMNKFYSYSKAVSFAKKNELEESAVSNGDEIQFWGIIPKIKKWGYVSTYGGKLLENATQAVAGDVMSNGAVKAAKAGYSIFMLVHDQAIAAYKPDEGHTVEDFCEILCDLPEWADGLPIEAEGGVIPYYLKD